MLNKNELQKTNQKEFRTEKVINRKDDKLYFKWKGYNNLFNSWINEKRYSINSEYFPGKGKVKVELDLSNYETKRDFENATGVHTSSFAKKFDLANLKSDVDKLDIGKLKNLQTNFNNLKSKIPSITNVAINAYLNAKINNVKGEIPSITNLATTSALTAVENKILVLVI